MNEKLICPVCGHTVTSARTLALDESKSIGCKKCGLQSSLSKWRTFASSTPTPARETSSSPPPLPAPSQVSPDISITNEPERIPCPSCSESIMPNASICPFCKRPVLAKNKQVNAITTVLATILLFFVIYYALMTFTRHEGNREYDRIMRQSEVETDRLMQNAERKTQEMFDRLGL